MRHVTQRRSPSLFSAAFSGRFSSAFMLKAFCRKSEGLHRGGKADDTGKKKRKTPSHHDSPERGTKRGLSLLYRYSACYLPTYFHALYYRITNFLDSHFPAWRSCGARCVANLFCNLSVPETMGRLSALALTTYVQLKRRQLNLCRKRATRCKTSTSALLSFSHKRSRPRAQVSSQASNPLASCLPLAQGRCR
jgi:hypothetical protein